MQLTEPRMTSLDKQLSQLVTEARRHPAGDLKRQQCLTKVIQLINQSHKLWQENTPYYEDALQQTWVYFCQNICEAGTGQQYDPGRSSIITWLNRYLKWRLKDYEIEKCEHRAKRLTQNLEEGQDIIANLTAPHDIPPILEETLQWIKSDPELDLRRTHIKNRPDINCQYLLLRRWPPEDCWESISEETRLPISTLSSFYQRQCIPRLRKFGKLQGYL
ncbi:MAG: sigma-70 family RNA polymerase sigma factor [Acaryochloridaceae cyanobacterium SU_2_1]|nr:sigma-70 family RNA polymerase sigma factor [Acaryochloridaceae cyanobacterium SU_2_1]NJM95089.1 sigma-70 family RNA polymerase sigma factor [Acaryochloridaceae cyanobacterium CSU_5_19]